MPEASHPDHLIRAGRLQADDARLFTPEADGPADQTPPDEPGWLVTLATWKAAAATLRARRHPVGVQLPPDARLDELTAPTASSTGPRCPSSPSSFRSIRMGAAIRWRSCCAAATGGTENCAPWAMS